MAISSPAFETVYSDNYRQVYSFLHKLCREQDAAEKLTKETFIQARRKIYQYNARCELITWLLGISAEVFLKHLQSEENGVFEIKIYVSDPEAPLSEEPGYRLEKEIDSRDLARGLSGISPRDTELLIMRLYGDIPYHELAGYYGISADSAKLIFLRTKERFKEVFFND